MKTEAIDLEREFVWFDDAPLQSEREVLARAGKHDALIIVDLKAQPEQLRRLVEELSFDPAEASRREVVAGPGSTPLRDTWEPTDAGL